ncbi:MauE/DoxX family redox-associated membrane protein [Streptomyces sp. NPDC004721]
MGEFRSAVLTWQGFLLIAAAAAKVRAPRRFAMAVAGYRLAPSALVEPLAWSVPGVEVILGAGLISGWHPTIMLRLAGALVVIRQATYAPSGDWRSARPRPCWGSPRPMGANPCS